MSAPAIRTIRTIRTIRAIRTIRTIRAIRAPRSLRPLRNALALVAVCLATGSLGAGAACAQAAQEPFSHVAFRGSLATTVRHNASYAHWRRGYGPAFSAATPFHAGDIEAGVALHRYAAALRNTPSWYAWFTFVGWGARHTSPGSWSVYGGLRAGMYHMIFDEEPGDEEEKEFALALVSRIDLHLSRDLRLFVEGHVMQAYTLPRFRAGGLTGGVGLRARTPDWLRGLLE